MDPWFITGQGRVTGKKTAPQEHRERKEKIPETTDTNPSIDKNSQLGTTE